MKSAMPKVADALAKTTMTTVALSGAHACDALAGCACWACRGSAPLHCSAAVCREVLAVKSFATACTPACQFVTACNFLGSIALHAPTARSCHGRHAAGSLRGWAEGGGRAAGLQVGGGCGHVYLYTRPSVQHRHSLVQHMHMGKCAEAFQRAVGWPDRVRSRVDIQVSCVGRLCTECVTDLPSHAVLGFIYSPAGCTTTSGRSVQTCLPM